MIGGDGENDDTERFADLVGETKPIRRGPARVDVERSTPQVGRRREPGGGGSGVAFRWPDPEEARLAGADGVSDAQLRALARGEPEPEGRIDLHGLRKEAAVRVLGDRLESARSRELRSVVIIHGRGQHSDSGEAILRDALPGWLSTGVRRQHVLAFAPAPNRLGGAGATLVLLRRR